MSWILGIDTSSVDLGVGLYADNQPVASFSRFLRHSHAEHIAQAVSMLLQTNSITPDQIDRCAITTGPGSFTGLRIGIGFMKGFCFGKDTSVLPVSSLEVLAFSRAEGNQGAIIAAIDARRGDVFWAKFESGKGGQWQRKTPDELTTADIFRAAIGESDIVITDMMGYGASNVFEFLNSRSNVYPVERSQVHRGLYCAALGAKSMNLPDIWTKPIDILPNYLRLSAAQLPGK